MHRELTIKKDVRMICYANQPCNTKHYIRSQGWAIGLIVTQIMNRSERKDSVLNNSTEKIGQEQVEDLYKDLEVLAIDIEKLVVARGSDLEFYNVCAQLLAELRSLMSELTRAKSGKTLLPLLSRYHELEGKVKEMRNDLSSPKAR
jgi:hypothetical protein